MARVSCATCIIILSWERPGSNPNGFVRRDGCPLSRSFTVYILYNPACGKTYVGQTASLAHRLHQHRTGQSTWTAKYPGDWRLIHHETFATRWEAMKRERQLKTGGGRRFIQGLLEGQDDGGTHD